MPTALIVLTRDAAAETGAADAFGRGRPGVRRLVPAAAPPGEYPAGDPGTVHAVWFVEEPAPADLAAVAALADVVEAYQVDSLVQWDEPDTDASRPETPMRLAFIVARGDLDREAFVARWRAHAPIAKAHQPDFRRYVQHVVEAPLTPSCGPFAAIGEFGFRRLGPGEGIRRFGSPEGQTVVEADIAGFLDPVGGRSLWVRPAP